MILDCVVSACNDNPLYIGFIPIFINTWKLLYPTTDIKIILIHDHIPDTLQSFHKYIELFKPIPNIDSAFISQYIRLLYPAILHQYSNGVLITDIDMIPMNSMYFTNNIKNIDNSKFVYLRNVLYEHDEIAMCYNIATPSTWSDIFNINSLDDINNRLVHVFTHIDYNNNWSCDQKHLYYYIHKWSSKTHNFIDMKDSDTGYLRLDRCFCSNFTEPVLTDIISNYTFSDYHMCRPHDKYQQLNNHIYKCLKNQSNSIASNGISSNSSP
jgi:hypothetical protein